MAIKLRVVVPPHPLIGHWLTMLRNESTPGALYSKGLEELGRWLTYEAIRDWIPHRMEEFQTSNSTTTGQIIQSEISILAIPSFPGGLELWYGARTVLPNPCLCLEGVPSNIENNAGILIYLDQITNGEKVLKVLKELRDQEISPKRIRVISVLASNDGLKSIGEAEPELTIYCCCIDTEMLNKNELKPGIGNPLLRLNTKI